MGKWVLSALLYGGGIVLFWYLLYLPRIWYRDFGSAWKSFSRDIALFGLRGHANRIATIQKNVARAAESGALDRIAYAGRKRTWEYRELYEKNLYEECARDIFESAWKFWFIYVLAPIFWPVAVCAHMLSTMYVLAKLAYLLRKT